MRSTRFATLVLFVGLALTAEAGTASSAFAAVPGNDDPAGAVVVTTVPSTFTQDTTEATTSAEETDFNSFCGAPALEHGVWYQATPTVDEDVVVDVTASDYGVGVLVLSGSPGSFTPLLCGPGQVSGPVTAGQTYYILLFGDGTTTATSGNLVVQFGQAVPAPTIALTIDPRGTVDKQGNATISGTVSCSSTDGSGTLIDIFVSVRQTVGRRFVDGTGDQFIGSPCDGTSARWQAFVVGETGKFAGGKAATVSIAFGCTDTCSDAFAETTVQLSKAKVH
jgi:hypothetical protein